MVNDITLAKVKDLKIGANVQSLKLSQAGKFKSSWQRPIVELLHQIIRSFHIVEKLYVQLSEETKKYGYNFEYPHEPVQNDSRIEVIQSRYFSEKKILDDLHKKIATLLHANQMALNDFVIWQKEFAKLDPPPYTYQTVAKYWSITLRFLNALTGDFKNSNLPFREKSSLKGKSYEYLETAELESKTRDILVQRLRESFLGTANIISRKNRIPI